MNIPRLVNGAETPLSGRQPVRNRSLKAGLIVSLCIINLVVVGYGAINLKRSWKLGADEAGRRTQTIAYAVEQSVSSSVDKIDLALQTVVDEVERERRDGHLDPARLHQLLAQQTRLLPEAAGFRITDAAGRIIIGLGDNSSLSASLGDRDYFERLRRDDTRSLVISKPVVGHVSSAWIIPFARSYHDPSGHFAGIVSVPISREFFNRMLVRFYVGPSGATSLRDSDLGLIARYPADSQGQALAVGSNNISQAMRDIAASGLAEKTYSTMAPYDSTVRVNTFLRVSNAPFFIIAGVAQEEYLKNWRRELLQTSIFLAVFILATSLLARMAYRAWREQARSNVSLQQRNAELATALQTLDEQEQALIAAQQAGALGTFTLEMTDGRLVCSDEAGRILGLAGAGVYHLDAWRQRVHPDDLEEMTARLRAAARIRLPTIDDEHRVVWDGGEVRWVHRLARLEYAPDGTLLRLRGVVQDVTQRHAADDQIALMREAFLHAAEGIMVTDSGGRILEINPAFARLSGYTHEEVLGQTPALFKSGLQDEGFYREMWESLERQGRWEGEFRNRRKDGSAYLQFTRISSIRDSRGLISRYIALASDVTLLRQSQQQIEHMAFHDKLTGLPNRALLAETLREALTTADQRKEMLGVCYVDLDGFKPINDEWGHDVGDDILCQVGKRFLANVRASDTVARMGGDEFVVLLSGLGSHEELTVAVQRLLSAVAQPFKLDQANVHLTMSIGVAAYPDDQIREPDSLIRHADQAMYVAKRSGKNRMHLFDPAAERRLREHLDLLSGVIAGLERGQFKLLYQPKVNMRSGEVVGAEALIRWQHPLQGLLVPGIFLPAVQETEYAVSMGEWVLRTALCQMRKWSRAGFHIPVSVNIFGYHLQRPDFVGRLTSLLAEFPDVDPTLLELEILETTIMEDIDEVSQRIVDCGALGVSFALDDFGTGYSSLSYFRRLPTQLLKIDQSFVFDMLSDTEDQALVEAIISLAKTFRRQVIAEGVESVAHGCALLALGCELGQGYGIARPMPAEELPAWASGWTAPAEWSVTGGD